MDTAQIPQEETAGSETEPQASANRLVLPSLEIKNFRAFRHLTIEKLGRVNLITGKNNVGKTSLLEALWLYGKSGDLSTVRQLVQARNETNIPLGFTASVHFVSDDTDYQNDWLIYVTKLLHQRPNFFNDAGISSIGEKNKDTNSIRLGVVWGIDEEEYEDDDEGKAKQLPVSQKIKASNESSSLKPFLRIKAPYKSETEMSFDDVHGPVYYTFKSSIPCYFISTKGFSQEQTGKMWDRVVLRGNEAVVYEALGLFGEEIDNIQLISLDDENRLPILRTKRSGQKEALYTKGEGMARAFGYSTALANAAGGILLIDEIENGLHYSVLPDVWRLIFQTARRLNVQVFATTHSWDCIEAFQQAASEDDDPASGVLVRLQNENGNVTSTVFDERRLAIVTRDGIEVR